MNIFLRKFLSVSLCLSGIILFSSCGKDINVKQLSKEERLWQDRDRRKMAKTQAGNGILNDLFSGRKDKNDSSNSSVISTDNPVWRASLETLSRFPLSSVDAGSGIIITEWYISEKKPTQRFKITVLVMENTISANSLKVSIYKQVIKKNRWINSKIDISKSVAIERKIIERAVEINSNI
ncbi:MAG: DUF3576 domain-containing protein [Pseudomonadota bacterium]|nr:DUF3576 domain-containing protein [Pseudomonadota bacterium]